MIGHAELIPFRIGDEGVQTFIYPSSYRGIPNDSSSMCRAAGKMTPARIEVTLNRPTTREELTNFVYLEQLLDTYFVFYWIPPVITISGRLDNEECNVVVRIQNSNYTVQVRKVS